MMVTSAFWVLFTLINHRARINKYMLLIDWTKCLPFRWEVVINCLSVVWYIDGQCAISPVESHKLMIGVFEVSGAVKTKCSYFFKEGLIAGGSQSVGRSISFLSFLFQPLSQTFKPGRKNMETSGLLNFAEKRHWHSFSH